MSFVAIDPAFTADIESIKATHAKKARVVLVTGASSGIGYAVAVHLHKVGHKVIALSRSAKTGEIINGILQLNCDITNNESVTNAVNWLSENKINISVLVNNAGNGLNGALEEVTTEQLYDAFNLNLFGLHRITKALLPQLRATKDAYIINISSIAGQIGLPYRGGYSATKFATEGYSESLRMELLPFGVKVILVEPGDFKTNINQNRKIASGNSDSPYYKNFIAINKKIVSEVNKADNPIKVGICIEKIIKTTNPKFRYKVAKPIQKFSITLSRLLPFTWFQKLLMKAYKL